MSPNPSARFEWMFELHHDAVQSYCLRRLPRNDVNDVVAEVFLISWRRIEEAPEGKELPWLYAIARNVVRNMYRSRARYRRLVERVGGTETARTSSPESQVVRRFEDHMVLEAMASLRHRDREILTLKTWEELSTSEIAASLGISVRAVEMRVNRSRKRLAQAYEKRERSKSASTSPRFVDGRGER